MPHVPRLATDQPERIRRRVAVDPYEELVTPAVGEHAAWAHRRSLPNRQAGELRHLLVDGEAVAGGSSTSPRSLDICEFAALVPHHGPGHLPAKAAFPLHRAGEPTAVNLEV